MDSVILTGPGMGHMPPQMEKVATGTDSEIDTPGFGTCPPGGREDCPQADRGHCIAHEYSDHKVVVTVECLRPGQACAGEKA